MKVNILPPPLPPLPLEAPIFPSASGARFYRDRGKRVLDVILCLLMAPLAVPVIALCWGVARFDGGAGFFAHERVGRDGQIFQCWKIRTMVPDAQVRLAAHLSAHPSARAEWAAHHKLRNDPRVTKIGAVLRKTSLDELPQIWNVLCGEMSLVGPRPIVRDELQRFGAAAAAYCAMSPGLTGLWQVQVHAQGRSDVTYAERVQMDLHYAKAQSLWLDLSLILRTVLTVLRRTGC